MEKAWRVVIVVVFALSLGALVILAAVGAFAGWWTDSEDAASQSLRELVDDYWKWRLNDSPEFATFVGYHDYNSRLDDLSLEAYQNRFDNVSSFHSKLNKIKGQLTKNEDIVNSKVLEEEFVTFLDGFPFRSFLLVINNKEGIHIDLIRLLGWMPKSSVADFEVALSRLERVPRQVQQIIQLLEEGKRSGIVMHERSMDKVAVKIETYLTEDPKNSPFYTLFSTLPKNFTEEEVKLIQTRAAKVIGEYVTPSFKQLFDWLSTKYQHRPEIGISTLPNGKALYDLIMVRKLNFFSKIRFYSGSSDSTPEEIHQKGYEEVRRIYSLMQQVVDELGINMTAQEFSEQLKKNSSQYYDSESELLSGFENLISNVTDPAIPKIFKSVPKAKLTVKADPSSTDAYYNSGTYDGSRPGVFYVGTLNVKSLGKFRMLTLALHEGNPGHHFQLSHAIESKSIPEFRSFTKDSNYAQAPSRFPKRSYYTEGWALYAEKTGFDLDLYGNPYDRFGHYSNEMLRACRLVVDTGIHALGWTRDMAIEYILKYTAMIRFDVESEVDRYITWPGQALSYKTGQLQISSLRSEAEKRLGNRFDIKEFHQVVLDSLGPMTVVKEQVHRWIEDALQRAS